MRLEALGHFIRNEIITTIHAKEWWLANIAMQAAATAEEAEIQLDKIESIAHAEIENAKDTIPAVEFDSRLGWEPSMEYVCDKWHIDWKIKQTSLVIQNEIRDFRTILHLGE